MNKRTIIFSLFLLCSLYCIELYGQESYLKNRWNIKLSYAPYPTGVTTGKENVVKNKSVLTTDIRLEANYGFLKFLEAGVYVGYSPFKDKYSIFGRHPYGHVLSYGLNANLHFLPFFKLQSEPRLDFYFTAKYGGRSSLTSNAYGNKHDLGFGLGFSWYFSRHTGMYAEWLLTNGLFAEYYRHSSRVPFFFEKSTFRVGFTVKFKSKNEK
ncbi:MAG: hypothetical protein LBI03_00595 [Clostridiales bacterium]|nr:hypothetical protein [Clostridiales bacterium]